ncbi:Trihelix transcription factor gtl1-like protein [Camponotus japonicus]
MHDIFSSQPWIEPVAIAGSNVTNENIENESQSKPVSKKRKLDKILEDYLEQSLKIQNNKENNTQKRHEEKMARLAKIEEVLTESIRNNK